MLDMMKLRLYGRSKGKSFGKNKKDLIDRILPKVKLELPDEKKLINPLVFFSNFSNTSEVWLEIGFGSGEHIIEQAKNNSKIPIIGCEAYLDGIASLLSKIVLSSVKNILIFPNDVRILLNYLKSSSLSRIFILFPDPWHKKKHHKRRLISDETSMEFSRVLKKGGKIFLSSDNKNYIDWIVDVFSKREEFKPSYKKLSDCIVRPENWIETRYELKAKLKGNVCYYLSYEKH